MNRNHALLTSVVFLLLCSLSLMLGHGIGLLGLFLIPLLAIVCTLIVRSFIEEIYASQHHDF